MSPESGVHLLRPAMLLVAFIAIPLVLIALWARAARRRDRAQLVAPRHTARFLPGHSEGRGLVRVALAALAMVFLGLSLSGPVRGWTMRNISRRGLDLVVCIDTSRSMLVRDIRPDRLSRAVREVSGLIDRLAGDRVALIAFSGDAREIAPLTHDRTTLKELLKRVSPDDNLVGGTDLGEALGAALSMFDGRTGAHEAVVLLTDGEDLAGEGFRVAEAAAEQGIRVYVVGMGTEQGGKIPVTDGNGERFVTDDAAEEVVSALSSGSLEELARVTGGEYLAATRSAAPLEELYRMRISQLEGRSIDGTEWVPHDRYQWALVLALICMLIEAGLRERVRTRSAALMLVLPLGPLGGMQVPDLGELRRLSESNEHEAALELASELLSDESFDAASKALRADIQYAVGLARHRAGERDAAISAFLSARDLAGPGELRTDAVYNVAASLLEAAEAARLLIPELGGPQPGALPSGPGMPPLGGGGVGGGPVLPGAQPEEGPDPLNVANGAYLVARRAHLDRVRLAPPDADTRANLELIQRRLRELEEIRQQREEDQEDQENDQQEQDQQSDEQNQEDSEEQESDDPSEESEPEESESEREDQTGDEEQETPESESGEDEQEEADDQEQSESDQQDASEEQEAKPSPAEETEERMMSREEIQRLLDQLAEIEEEAQRVQAALNKQRRVPVEKDW